MKTLNQNNIVIELTIEEAKTIENALIVLSNRHDKLADARKEKILKDMWKEESKKDLKLWSQFYNILKEYGKN